MAWDLSIFQFRNSNVSIASGIKTVPKPIAGFMHKGGFVVIAGVKEYYKVKERFIYMNIHNLEYVIRIQN